MTAPVSPSAKYVAYFRVSTAKQGLSGLGLDAQREIVRNTCTDGVILREFTEIESGKRNDRPKLAAALALAKAEGATLVVAKLDRLARNLGFLIQLQEAGVQFKACDLPGANKFTLHVMMALAQQERELISQRTKDGLAQARKRGKLLGAAGHQDKTASALNLAAAREAAALAKREATAQAYTSTLHLIEAYRMAGMSVNRIAAALNEKGYPTRKGGQWSATQVSRVLAYATT